jgi:hypothetical protein
MSRPTVRFTLVAGRSAAVALGPKPGLGREIKTKSRLPKLAGARLPGLRAGFRASAAGRVPCGQIVY